MSMAGYTKLFNSILASTIWRANDKTRIVWITLLAMADKDGICEGSVPGLADLSRVSIEDCEAALEELSSPDPYSRTSEHEGRRIETIDGVGWKLLNHAKYRQKMSEDERREYNRRKQAEHRAKQKEEELAMSNDVNECQTTSMTVNDSQSQSAMSAHTEADTKAKKDIYVPKTRKKKDLTTIPDDFTLTDDMRTWFAEHCHGLNVDIETNSFIERCKSKGTEYKDWKAGWKTQMMNAYKWALERNGQSAPTRRLGEFTR